MNRKWLTISTFALLLGPVGWVSASAHGAPPVAAPAAVAGQDHGGWDEAPGEFREAQRKGFHDGIEAARSDFNEHRHPDVERHGSYKHPDVSHADREDYRDGFRRGYDAGMAHMTNGGPR